MKSKGHLLGFSSIQDENGYLETHQHRPLTCEGICDDESIKGERHCLLRPSKCLHGMFDHGNLTTNNHILDRYYARQMDKNIDFDERFFFNLNGLQNTPIKLVSPLYHFSAGSPQAVSQHNSMSAGRKSPLNKGVFGAMAAQNHQAYKRPRGESLALEFVLPAADDEEEGKTPTKDAFFKSYENG
jgi:hypothetical protein